MPSPTTLIGPWQFPTFALFTALAVLVGAGLGAFRLRRVAVPGHVADACLLALILGVGGARLGHVLLNWTYFAENLDEIRFLVFGGLNWHGAVIGAVIGLYLGALWRKLDYALLLDALAMALPLVGFGVWYGCWGAHCAYGAEVDTLARYPTWAAAESADVFGILAPRYNTQLMGMVMCAGVLLLIGLLIRRGWLKAVRFWFVLALFSLGMFALGWLRGDYAPRINGLRADQWLDLIFVFQASAIFILRLRRERMLSQELIES